MRDQIKMEKYVEFVYRAMRERFWDLQYELRMSTGWDDFSFVPLPMQNQTNHVDSMKEWINV